MENKQKINAMIVSVLIAGLLIGGVAGGALYALLFDGNETTDTTQQNNQSTMGGEIVLVEGASSSDDPVLQGSVAQVLNLERGIHACRFMITGKHSDTGEQIAPVIRVPEEGNYETYYEPGEHAADVRVEITNEGAWSTSGGWGSSTLYSEWDATEYSGVFGLRSAGAQNYPIISVNVNVYPTHLLQYNDQFDWSVDCNQVAATLINPDINSFTKASTGNDFFEVSLQQGDYRCEFTQQALEQPEYSVYGQPYLIGGGGASVVLYSDYLDYAKDPSTTFLLQTNAWSEQTTTFSVNSPGVDQSLLMEVSPAHAEKDVEWSLSCNKINEEEKTDSLKRTGRNVERFYSNLKPGVYECTTNAIGGYVEYPGQDPIRLVSTDPDSVTELSPFELTVTETSVPYIVLQQNYHGYGGEYTLECNQK